MFRKTFLLTMTILATTYLAEGERNYVTNGNFQDTDLGNRRWGLFETIPGEWYSSNDHKIEIGQGRLYNPNWEEDTRVAELASTGDHALQTRLEIPQGWYDLTFRYAARKNHTNGNFVQLSIGNNQLWAYESEDLEVRTYNGRVWVEEGDMLSFTGDGNNDTFGMTVTDITLFRELVPPVGEEQDDDFFQEFADLPGADTDDNYEDEHFELERHDLYDDEEVREVDRIVTTVHDEWFSDNNVDPQQILDEANWGLDNHVEQFVGNVYPSPNPDNVEYQVYANKADQWCFVKIGRGTADQKVFFFECEKILEGKAFLRAMNEDCTYPPVVIQPPVVEEICYMQAKKGKDIVSQTVAAYGDENSTSVVDCYVEALTKVKQGDVETMCTKDAVVEEWEALTHTKLEELHANADEVVDVDDLAQ